MTYTTNPPTTSAAPSADPDVAVARALGAITARLARNRDEFHRLAGDQSGWMRMAERGITIVIESFAPLIPEYRGRSARRLLQQEGAARVASRIATCDPAQLGSQSVRTLLSARLSLLALQRGAVPQPLSECAGTLDVFFDPAQRRAVRRLVERIFERSGADRVRIDFAANWRTGSSCLIRMLDRETVGAAFQSNGPGLVALVIWLFFADCWAVQANPISVAYLTAMQLGYERWLHGSDAYRQALTEALVVATREDLTLDGLDDVGSAAWAGILTGELLDWAGSILVGFQDAMEQPDQLAGFRVFDFVATLERAGKRGRGFETVEDHLRRLTYKVVRLDADHVEVRSAAHDPGQRIPEVFELRSRLAGAKLSRRERQVLALRLEDLDFKAIGRELHISPDTARVLMHRVRRSVGAKHPPRRKRA